MLAFDSHLLDLVLVVASSSGMGLRRFILVCSSSTTDSFSAVSFVSLSVRLLPNELVKTGAFDFLGDAARIRLGGALFRVVVGPNGK